MLHTLPSLRSILILVVLTAFVAVPSPSLRADDAASPPKKTTKKPAAGKTASDKAAPAKDTVEGTLTINGTSYKLSHVAIYESKFFDDVQVTVLASSKPLPLGKLKNSLKEDGSDDHMFLFEPHVKLSFNADGKLAFIFAWADNNNINKSGGDDLKGEFVNEDGRITGSASLKSEEDSTIKCDYDLKFSGNLISLPKTEDKPESPSETTTDEPGSVKGTVEGTLKINDVSVKLTHVVIY
ncbi:MAG: hypothetical protein KDA84_21705, partial [Planctomycetaceae bacterium]|nr:hypothetical protein [Planctomycetaceae bacterium]